MAKGIKTGGKTAGTENKPDLSDICLLLVQASLLFPKKQLVFYRQI